MQSTLNLGLSSVLLETIQKLHTFGQFFGCASFTYTPGIGFQNKPINIISFVFFTVLSCSLIYFNMSTELSINAKGYAAILFYVGTGSFACNGPLGNFNLAFFLFVFRKKIAKLMEDLMAFDGEVCNSFSTEYSIQLKL